MLKQCRTDPLELHCIKLSGTVKQQTILALLITAMQNCTNLLYLVSLSDLLHSLKAFVDFSGNGMFQSFLLLQQLCPQLLCLPAGHISAK